MGFVHDFRVRVRGLLRRLRPPQMLLLGFFSYVVIGVLLLSLPFARTAGVGLVDTLFMVTSGVSTTGLTTVSVRDNYNFFGQFVLMALFQVGGIGYMVVSSFVILARKRPFDLAREGVLKAQFSLPPEFNIRHFVWQVVIFTLVIEAAGALALYLEFAAYGVPNAAWHAVFHSVSAFCTAGFSLNNDSLEVFAASPTVNITVTALAYLGGIGFIVLADLWQSVRRRSYRLTFTSKVILAGTVAIFVICTPLLFFLDPEIAGRPLGERALAAMFQVGAASSTSGFNTVTISKLGGASLILLTFAMIVGASPCGTGGGVKTTSLSALVAVALGVMRGETRVAFGRREIPAARVHGAVANMSLYLATLAVGVYALGLAQHRVDLPLLFEAASALGTVGLSMGYTGELNDAGKLIVTGLMFVGRVGAPTLGLAFFGRRDDDDLVQVDLKEVDLTV